MTEPRHPWTPGHLLSTALVAGMISGYVLAGWALEAMLAGPRALWGLCAKRGQ